MGMAKGMPRIIRVFPRRTKATPDDPLAFVNRPPGLIDEADEVHVSVAFTWDLPAAERLAKQWECVAPVKIGGPATGKQSGDFVPGLYLKHGFTITSRGCPNKCWFCSVWKREGGIRELPICEGYNVLDDNLLACSDDHIKSVFVMLERQEKRVQFTGGLEAARLKDWHVEGLYKLRIASVNFAYDTSDDLEPLRRAGKMLVEVGLITRSNYICRCYVLVGFPKDIFSRAERRIYETMQAGFVPYIMPYRGQDGCLRPGWGEFRRRWHGYVPVVHDVCEEERKSLFGKVSKERKRKC